MRGGGHPCNPGKENQKRQTRFNSRGTWVIVKEKRKEGEERNMKGGRTVERLIIQKADMCQRYRLTMWEAPLSTLGNSLPGGAFAWFAIWVLGDHDKGPESATDTYCE